MAARFGLSVSYSFDGERLLGTGGALRRALPLLGPDFFVLYGDSYLEIAYAAVQAAYRRAGQPALMTVFRNDGRVGHQQRPVRRRRVVRYDKRQPAAEMKYIDYGLGILNERLCSALDGGVRPVRDLRGIARIKAGWPDSRRQAGSMKSARRRGWRKRTII